MSGEFEPFPDLFEKARKDGLWFHCSYQDLWFTPDQLEAEQKAGRFRWGRVNWTLRDPHERLEQAHHRRDAAQSEVNRIERLMRGGTP